MSFEAACVLAGTPPWELEAEVLSTVYRRRAEARNRDGAAPEEVARWRQDAKRAAMMQWHQRLENPSAGHWTIGAVRPVLDRWVDRKEGVLTFHLTQVLSGHGCFGNFLCRIGREQSAACHQCGAATDTAEHTLATCQEWEQPRQVLRAAIGPDLSLEAVANAMVSSTRSWDAVVSFCDTVIRRKEEAERERDPLADPLADANRRRRTGRRRRLYGQLHPS